MKTAKAFILLVALGAFACSESGLEAISPKQENLSISQQTAQSPIENPKKWRLDLSNLKLDLDYNSKINKQNLYTDEAREKLQNAVITGLNEVLEENDKTEGAIRLRFLYKYEKDGNLYIKNIGSPDTGLDSFTENKTATNAHQEWAHATQCSDENSVGKFIEQLYSQYESFDMRIEKTVAGFKIYGSVAK